MIGQRAARVLQQLRAQPLRSNEVWGAGAETIRRMDWANLLRSTRPEHNGETTTHLLAITPEGIGELAEWEAAQQRAAQRKADKTGGSVGNHVVLIAALTNAEKCAIKAGRGEGREWIWAPYRVAEGTLAPLVAMGLIERPARLAVAGWNLMYKLTDLGHEVAEELRLGRRA